MRVDRLDRLVVATLAGVALATAAMLTLDEVIGARVIGLDPPPETTIGARAGLGVIFAEPMDRGTVESRFSIEPEVRGSFRWTKNEMRFVPSEPLRSGETYTLRIEPGARSSSGQPVRQTIEAAYTVHPPQLLFLSPGTPEAEIWIAPVATSGSPRQLTHSNGRVRDYAASPDGAWIIYTAANDLGGSDLWSLEVSSGKARLRLDCGFDICQQPSWSPDGMWIAYGRQTRANETAPPDPPRLWTMAWPSAETGPVYLDTQVLGEYPSWSPDGKRLAFYDHGVTGIRILDLETGAQQVLPTLMGAVGTWSPDGGSMAFTQLQMQVEGLMIDLYRADLLTNEFFRVPIAESGLRDLGAPAWSPRGDWLAISVREGAFALSRQIWLVRSDGSEVRTIATDPAFAFGGYRWDPAGDRLAMQRYPVLEAEAKPEVVVWDLATNTLSPVASDAWLAGWLP